MKNNLVLEEITNRIVNVRAPTHKDLGWTFVRFQEKYEGDKFKDRDSFSRKSVFREWGKTEESKEDPYWEYWEAFNLPSEIIEIVAGEAFAPHTRREIFLIETTKPVIEKYGNVYTFGTVQGEKGQVGRHEMGHALVYTNNDYKAEVMNILGKLNPEVDEKLRKYFSRLGYHPDVMDDELHAWIMTERERYVKPSGVLLKDIADIRKALNQNYDRFFKELKK